MSLGLRVLCSVRRPVLVGATVGGLVVGLLVAPTAYARPIDRLSAAAPATAAGTLEDLSPVGDSAATASPGGTVLLAAPADRPVARPDEVASDASPARVARAHLDRLEPLLDLADGSPPRLVASATDPLAGQVVRFEQRVDGLPVYGSSVVLSLDDAGGLRSVGASLTAADSTGTGRLGAARAARLARAAAAEQLQVPVDLLESSTPRRYLYDPALFDEPGSPLPVWRVVARVPRSAASTEALLDARDGSVVSVSGAAAHLRRAVCDSYLPGVVDKYDLSYDHDAAYGWCGEQRASERYRDTNHDGRINGADAALPLSVPYARSEGQPATGATEVDAAYDALGDTAALYAALGVDLTELIGPTDSSIGAGSTATRRLAGVVNYCDPVENYYSFPFNYSTAVNRARAYCPYGNAFWYADDLDWSASDGTPYPGGQMFIGRGLAASVDVIGHEMSHGVTAATSGLVYRGQSGAINESMSDVLGQLAETYADPGADPDWLIGDSLAGPRIHGAIRSMRNPPVRLGEYDGRQPDRMTSRLWDTDPLNRDYGGVHTNSGVGNKAAWLIAHGGSFNGTTVRPLDTANPIGSAASSLKVARLYWTTQQLLPSSASYRTLAATLYQACRQLVGSHGFVLADCTRSVVPAVAATEMTRTTVTSTVSRTKVKHGGRIKVTAQVRGARGAAVTAPVRLQRRAKGSSNWTTVASGTATGGTWTVRTKPRPSARYRVVAGGTLPFAAAPSASTHVKVRAKVTRKVSRRAIRAGQRIRVRGKVSPSARGRVLLQRKVNGRWRTVKKARLTKGSKYVLRYKVRSTKDRRYRVRRPAGATNASGVSKKFRIRVS